MSYSYYSAPRCPVVLHNESIQSDTTDYLIHRHVMEANKYSTVENDARHLASFLNFLDEHDLTLYEATSERLVAFRDLLHEEHDLSEDYVNKHLDSICAFYWFAQQRGWVANMIGWRDKATGEEYRIRVNKTSKNSNSRSEYTIPYRLKNPVINKQYVPSDSEIDDALVKLAERKSNQTEALEHAIKTRDSLIIRWLTTVGLRREEFVSLEVSDIENLEDSVGFVTVKIDKGTKFDKDRSVQVLRTLIDDTLEYIEFERDEILEHWSEKFGDPSKIPEIFVNAGNRSSKPRMDAKSVYDLLKSLNRKLTPHACRRYALTQFATVMFRIEMELAGNSQDRNEVVRKNLLEQVRLQAGHESVDTTIRFYVDTAKSRYLSKTASAVLSQREQEIEMELALIRRIKSAGARRALF